MNSIDNNVKTEKVGESNLSCPFTDPTISMMKDFQISFLFIILI